MAATFDIPISIVIPMYNEVDNVEPLVREVVEAMQAFSQYEIVVVDDGSKDGTVEKLQALQNELPQLRCIRHAHNYGQSAGVVTGVKHAKYAWIVTLDGDGQNDPKDIPNLVTAIPHGSKNKPVLIAGNRQKRNDNWLRRTSSQIANNTRQALLKDNCADTGCGIKLFPRDTFLQIPHFNHLHRFLPALIQRAGGTIINIPVNHRPRIRGKSKYGVMNRLWVGIVDMFGVSWLIRRPCSPEVADV